MLARRTLKPRNRVEEYELRALHMKNDSAMSGDGKAASEFRINRILKHITFAITDWVLDVGPGHGFLFEKLRGKVAQCHGIDPSPAMVERLSRKFRRDRTVRFAVSKSDNLPFENTTFDKVILSGMIFLLDDVEEVRRTLNEVRRVSKDEAQIFIGDVPFVDESVVVKTINSIPQRVLNKFHEEGMFGFFQTSLESCAYHMRVLAGFEPKIVESNHGLFFSAEEFLSMCKESGLTAGYQQSMTHRGLSPTRNDYFLHITHSSR